jgi:hypothetical protein
MFAQLVKHEFRATRRIMPWIYLVTALLIGGSLLVDQLGIRWLRGLVLALMALGGLAGVIMTYVLTIQRYYRNIYDAEGYLTHTLPVRSGQILGSKILVAFGWILASYILLLGVIVTIILLMSDSLAAPMNLDSLIQQAAALTGLTRQSFNGLILAVAAYLCLSILYLLAQVFFAITLGNLSRLHALGLAAPVLIWLGLYLACQIGILVFMVLIPLGLTVDHQTLKFIPQGMWRTLFHPEEFIFGLGSVLFIILATIGLFAGTNRLIRKSTSLR